MIGGNETFVCAFKYVFISGMYESNNKILIVAGMVINGTRFIYVKIH